MSAASIRHPAHVHPLTRSKGVQRRCGSCANQTSPSEEVVECAPCGFALCSQCFDAGKGDKDAVEDYTNFKDDMQPYVSYLLDHDDPNAYFARYGTCNVCGVKPDATRASQEGTHYHCDDAACKNYDACLPCWRASRVAGTHQLWHKMSLCHGNTKIRAGTSTQPQPSPATAMRRSPSSGQIAPLSPTSRSNLAAGAFSGVGQHSPAPPSPHRAQGLFDYQPAGAPLRSPLMSPLPSPISGPLYPSAFPNVPSWYGFGGVPVIPPPVPRNATPPVTPVPDPVPTSPPRSAPTSPQLRPQSAPFVTTTTTTTSSPPPAAPAAAQGPRPDGMCVDCASFHGRPEALHRCSSCYKKYLAAHPPAPAPAEPPAAAVTRCQLESCGKKLGLHGIKCLCGLWFCKLHHHDFQHNCTYDYKTSGRTGLATSLVKVEADKVHDRL